MSTHHILPAILLCFCVNVFGQYTEHYERSALASYYSKDYKTALIFSEKVLELDVRNLSALFVAGESARMIQDYEKAESYLEQIPDKAKAGYYSVTDFRLANVKEILGKKDEAIRYYRQYLSARDHGTDLLALFAKEALEMLESGVVVDRRKGEYVSVSRLPENINSELMEAAPLRYADKLYFTSVYMADKKAKPVTRLYESKLDGTPRLVEANPQNEELNAAYMTLMPDASRIYYAICQDNDYLQAKQCQIWSRDRKYEGGWGPPKKLPPLINMRGYTATQPTVGWDKTLKKYVLFFASDRPGGKGKMDIWCSAIRFDGEFEEPMPLPTNSEEDDVSPYFHQASQTLFFSSKGLPGYGGFDIFRTRKNANGEWESPENLGELLNSRHDDLDYSFHTQTKSAYFVSNRPASRCNEKGSKMNCLDIYEARVFVEVRLQTFNGRTKQPVMAPQVEILEIQEKKPAGSFAANSGSNALSIKLETGKRYRLSIMVNGYEQKEIEVDTRDYSYFATLDQTLFLNGYVDP